MPTKLPSISDAERRTRLIARHHLARTADSPPDAARGVVALHASDPATPYLSVWARVAGFETDHLDHCLLESRTLWRMHAMRRTLFVVPTDEGSVFHAGAGRAVAKGVRSRLERWVSSELGVDDVSGWLEEVERGVETALAGGVEMATKELSVAVPRLLTSILVGSGKWSARVSLSSRLLVVMALERRLVRTRPAGSWRSSQYSWTTAPAWFGAAPEPTDDAGGRRDLLRRYLEQSGPATLTDIRWWTGWTAKAARAALDDLLVTPVALDSGQEAYVLEDDLGTPATQPTPQVALLPSLDPTPMGWKERDWYFGCPTDRLFDRNGNVGPTVWVDGRVVGGWGQRADGEVACVLLAAVSKGADRRIRQEAAALTHWLGGVRVATRFPTPLEREIGASAR